MTDSVVFYGIAGLAVIIVGIVAAMVRISDPLRFPKVFAALVVLMAIQFAAAQSGLLRDWKRTPPLIAPLILISLALATILAFSRVGDAMIRKLSIPILIGFQVFRLPLELVMHRAATHGIMPPQMTFTGDNFDILSGTLALPAAWMAARGSRASIIAWNAMGSLLLTVILVIAVISMPMIAAFGPDKMNTWVADPPYIWLPGILVPAALLGHLLVWRSLSRKP